MISKKEMLTLGVLAIGGIGVASMVSGGGDGDGGGGAALQGRAGRAGGILGSQQGYGAPTIYNLPAQGAVTFPKVPSFDISKFLKPQEVSRGAAGVSAAPKKYREAGVGLGYKGYVTPTVPTPVSPGYISGTTTFKKYEEPAYIPSPVKPPSVSYGSGGSKKSVSTPKATAKSTSRRKKLISRAQAASK